jgi:hypothetical protein
MKVFVYLNRRENLSAAGRGQHGIGSDDGKFSGFGYDPIELIFRAISVDIPLRTNFRFGSIASV